MTVRKSWRRVDGVLLLDKPTGMSSNSALQAARRLFSAAKAGHSGTLDPMASGLLPLCFGEATKFSVDLLAADKTYEAELLFGIRTDTGDADGMVVMQSPVTFGRAELEAALNRFRGPILQIPPMYSALKRNGRPLYELARQGIEVEREARAVTIHELWLLDFSQDRCRLRVACSKGTYIRSLAEDLGAALACGAHLTVLRRVAVGPLRIIDAVTLDQLAALAEEARADWLLPPDALLQSLPAVHLDHAAGRRFVHGNPVCVVSPPGRCRVYSGNQLLGLGELDDAGRLQPRRVLGAP
ncbi:tRNA pseudouridine(55) synthase TruB [Candidatus Accumulibacter vicinus]|uniref:tRNA pseudouridine synthase B n=1 Tax=Candidatus Accumulibacter vicinus TaxID=2954382 RepID=A0A084XZ10_9PROT|nr:tRNA pseudouridine(55) synthase TruB [Candidatus Accumulibacter vicinus]KFB67704.1 MAG: tRNA pseudouridine synthase B [Candidatus Accumulibacter vicinus]